MIDEYATHGGGRESEEVSAVLPLHVAQPKQAHERLVDNSSGLKGVAAALVAKEGSGNAAQLLHRGREQSISCERVASMPLV